MERKVLLGKKLGIFYEKKGFVGKKFFQRMRCVRDAQRVILSLSSCRHQGSLLPPCIKDSSFVPAKIMMVEEMMRFQKPNVYLHLSKVDGYQGDGFLLPKSHFNFSTVVLYYLKLNFIVWKAAFNWKVDKDWSSNNAAKASPVKREVVLFSGYFAICSFCRENASVSVILSEMPLLWAHYLVAHQSSLQAKVKDNSSAISGVTV